MRILVDIPRSIPGYVDIRKALTYLDTVGECSKCFFVMVNAVTKKLIVTTDEKEFNFLKDSVGVFFEAVPVTMFKSYTKTWVAKQVRKSIAVEASLLRITEEEVRNTFRGGGDLFIKKINDYLFYVTQETAFSERHFHVRKNSDGDTVVTEA